MQRLTFWLAMALAIWLGAALAPWIWRVVWPETTVLVLAQTVSGMNTKTQEATLSGRAIAARHLFGQPKAVEAAKMPTDVPPPKTRLNLVLYGVQASDDPAGQGAIIGAPGRPSDYYRVGEALPGGPKLAAVYADHVILDRQGVREALYFSEESERGIEVSENRQPQVTPEMFLKRAQNELKRDPEKALASVGLATAPDGQGYVYQGNNPMLNAMNMQKGDVIRSVNGYVLGNIQDDQKLLQQLYEQGSLQVEIERGGATFTINYALR